MSSGFLVTPRVNGTQVVLDIEQQDERVANGSVQTQRLTTQVSGPLGEWIRLGGVSESSSTQTARHPQPPVLDAEQRPRDLGESRAVPGEKSR